jgi:hypothetical protein
MALNSQLLTVQILTNDVQVLILSLSYFIATVICLSLCISLNQVYQVGRRRATAQCYYIHVEKLRAEQGKHRDESYLKGN